MVSAITYSTDGQWSMNESPLCGCGETQTIRNIVETCLLTKFDGELRGIHGGGENAIKWLENLDICLWKNLTQQSQNS